MDETRQCTGSRNYSVPVRRSNRAPSAARALDDRRAVEVTRQATAPDVRVSRRPPPPAQKKITIALPGTASRRCIPGLCRRTRVRVRSALVFALVFAFGPQMARKWHRHSWVHVPGVCARQLRRPRQIVFIVEQRRDPRPPESPRARPQPACGALTSGRLLAATSCPADRGCLPGRPLCHQTQTGGRA